MLIGRDKEVKLLQDLLFASESQFVVVYGRRRVGKTFLVREAFNYKFAFQHTGIYNAPMKEQLKEFRESLYAAGMKKAAMPKTWNDAFHLLENFISGLPADEKKVIFIDELPWMDTHKSNFVRSLDHFWNGWATRKKTACTGFSVPTKTRLPFSATAPWPVPGFLPYCIFPFI